MNLIPTSTTPSYRVTDSAQVQAVVTMEDELIRTDTRLECDDSTCPCHAEVITSDGYTTEGNEPPASTK